jgi:hypothetical protein
MLEVQVHADHRAESRRRAPRCKKTLAMTRTAVTTLTRITTDSLPDGYLRFQGAIDSSSVRM